jgi:hypothetical protein
MKCNLCNKEISSACDWQQGRCPHKKKLPLTLKNILEDRFLWICALAIILALAFNL